MKKSVPKFLAIGFVAFVLDYGLTLLLHYSFGVTGYIASAVSFTVGFLFSFSLSRQWVFRSDSKYKYSVKQQALFYFSLAGINLFISTAIVAGFSKIDIDVYISKVITIVLIATWNFIISHFVIFANKKN